MGRVALYNIYIAVTVYLKLSSTVFGGFSFVCSLDNNRALKKNQLVVYKLIGISFAIAKAEALEK